MVRLAKRERSGVQIRSTAFSSAVVPTGQVEKDLDPFVFRSLSCLKEATFYGVNCRGSRSPQKMQRCLGTLTPSIESTLPLPTNPFNRARGSGDERILKPGISTPRSWFLKPDYQRCDITLHVIMYYKVHPLTSATLAEDSNAEIASRSLPLKISSKETSHSP